MSNEEETEDTGSEYILVDFDRTLSIYRGWKQDGKKLGPPVPAMVERVVRWLKSGMEVRLFTARASRYEPGEMAALRAWCVEHLGKEIKIQNYKDFNCIAIWDDLAVGVESNTGFREAVENELDPLTKDEEYELVEAALKKLEGSRD